MNTASTSHIVCPHCHTTNRVKADQLSSSPTCAQCKQAWFTGHPPALDAEASLDAATQKAAQDELIKQAKGTTPMRLAQGAARNAVEQSFAMPLKAAGIDAKVTARFANTPAE